MKKNKTKKHTFGLFPNAGRQKNTGKAPWKTGENIFANTIKYKKTGKNMYYNI